MGLTGRQRYTATVQLGSRQIVAGSTDFAEWLDLGAPEVVCAVFNNGKHLFLDQRFSPPGTHYDYRLQFMAYLDWVGGHELSSGVTLHHLGHLNGLMGGLARVKIVLWTETLTEDISPGKILIVCRRDRYWWTFRRPFHP